MKIKELTEEKVNKYINEMYSCEYNDNNDRLVLVDL